MENVTAILSMLHEPQSLNSATRLFRQQPVLAWTLQRISMSRHIGSIAVICWEDQLESVSPVARERDAHILVKGPRTNIQTVDSIAAARRWSDGWRSGLLQTCDFDLGFHAHWVREIIQNLASDAVILVDPSAGLVDPHLLDKIVEHAQARPNIELCFTPAAPGLAGALLRPAMVDRLTGARSHPGRILHYLPDQPMRDPVGGDACVPVPAPVARTTHNFKLDSQRQVTRMTEASVHLNGELVSSDSEDLVNRLRWTSDVDSLPREVVLELNTNRATSPIFWPGKHHSIERAPISVTACKQIFEQLSAADDVRLTIAGVGDPLLHPDFLEIVREARASGIRAIHAETDLLPENSEWISEVVESEIDAVSVHLPAMSQETYVSIMGIDAFARVIENIRQFIVTRQQRASGVPILVPTFVKCRQNLGEMEVWFDQWLKILGAAVITGPSDFAGMIPDSAVADMSPPRRNSCRRLWSRMTINCDGKVISCEQDVLARQIMGYAFSQPISEIWKSNLSPIRAAHKSGCWSTNPTCAGCREWHRP